MRAQRADHFWFRALLLCGGLLLSPLLSAHPYHTSLMEMEWNAGEQHWELALRFLPEDLEDALQFAAAKRVDLEHTADIDALLLSYLQQHLRFLPAHTEDAAAVPATEWHWVGKDVEYKAVWLYVTVKAAPVPLRLHNTLLFERNPQQVNRVFLLDHGQRIPFEFNAQADSPLQLIQRPN